MIVALFVLTFDFWLYKAVVLTGSVCVTLNWMRRTHGDDWRTWVVDLAGSGGPPGRQRTCWMLLIAERVDRLGRSGQRLAAIGGRRELERLDRERRDLPGWIARRAEPLPDPAGSSTSRSFRPIPSRTRSSMKPSGR